jgi:hypothetical protein
MDTPLRTELACPIRVIRSTGHTTLDLHAGAATTATPRKRRRESIASAAPSPLFCLTPVTTRLARRAYREVLVGAVGHPLRSRI